MRYRIGDDPTIAAYGSTPEWLGFTALLGLVIGVVLGYLAWRGRQRWLLVWSVGLVATSIAYATSQWWG